VRRGTEGRGRWGADGALGAAAVGRDAGERPERTTSAAVEPARYHRFEGEIFGVGEEAGHGCSSAAFLFSRVLALLGLNQGRRWNLEQSRLDRGTVRRTST